MYVLLSGQSNALGIGDGGPSTVSPLVQVWNNDNTNHTTNGNAFIPPVLGTSPFYLDNNNSGLHFADAAAVALNVPIYLTIVANGGYPIEQWITSDDGVAVMRDSIVAAWQTKPPADVYLWDQGEANASEDFATYAPKFREMITLLKAANVLAADCKIVVGGLLETQPVRLAFNVNVLSQLPLHYSDTFYASSTGLAEIPGNDGHFTGDALAQFGGRYWDAVQNAIEGDAMGLVVSQSVEIATEAEAEAGTRDDVAMTPLKTAQAIAALAPTGSGSGSGTGSGVTVQRVTSMVPTVATGTTVLPFDNTIPQSNEGDQYMSLAITPLAATNILDIEVNFFSSSSTADTICAALFRDSAVGAVAATASFTGASTGSQVLPLRYSVVAGSTAATTFKVRGGPSSPATLTFNGTGGIQNFGGVACSSITITERTP